MLSKSIKLITSVSHDHLNRYKKIIKLQPKSIKTAVRDYLEYDRLVIQPFRRGEKHIFLENSGYVIWKYFYLRGAQTQTDDNIYWVEHVLKLNPIEFELSMRSLRDKTLSVEPIQEDWLLKQCNSQVMFADKISRVDLSNHDDLIENYHIFLRRLRDNPGKHFSPDLKQDFVWHAHMMDDELYCADTKNIFGRILDHKIDLSDKPKEHVASCSTGVIMGSFVGYTTESDSEEIKKRKVNSTTAAYVDITDGTSLGVITSTDADDAGSDSGSGCSGGCSGGCGS
jgi:hypothetical protein